jgi:hypothetical protein
VNSVCQDIYDQGDYCLRSSLYIVGKTLSKTLTREDIILFYDMVNECRLNKWLGHRKSAKYTWSVSDGLTKRLYDWFGINLFKGLNHDQYRAYFIFLYLYNDWLGALKVMFGYLIRCFFTPSLMEHAFLKPQAYVLLLKVKFPFNIQYLWYPLYLTSLMFLKLSIHREFNIKIAVSTTNKISLIPTALLLGQIKLVTPFDFKYVENVYTEYFKDSHVGLALINGIGVYNGYIR